MISKEQKTAWIKIARSGWDYRQATLIIYISADGIKRCNPFSYFQRWYGGGGAVAPKMFVSKEKMTQYN